MCYKCVQVPQTVIACHKWFQVLRTGAGSVKGVLGFRYLAEGYEQQTAALPPAGEAQVAVGGVERPGRVRAGVGGPHGAGGHLVEPLGPGQPEQSQDVLPQSLLLQNPGGGQRVRPRDT